MSPISLIILAVGLALVLAGVLAYSGKWTGWAESTSYLICGPFAAPLFGVAFILFSLAGSFSALSFVYSPAVFFPVMGLAGIAFFALPGFLLPRWFRTGRKSWRELERAAQELSASARRMKRGEHE